MTAPRFELSGAFTPSGPPGPGNPSNPPTLVFTYNANDTLDVQHYLDLGYTRFDVICIGGSGGDGGGMWGSYLSSGGATLTLQAPGGAGGGGGLHYVKRGFLRLLPDLAAIVVGQGGAPGVNDTRAQSVHAPSGPDQSVTTNGADGTASTFAGTTCMASGGKGGKKYAWSPAASAPMGGSYTGPGNYVPIDYLNDGGDGGLGGTTVAGGGGAGGKALRHNGTINQWNTEAGDIIPVAGAPGNWNPATGIGGGGGGGAGGADYFYNTGTAGGGGSFNASDTSVYSPGSTPQAFVNGAGAVQSQGGSGGPVPGYAGGGKAAPLTGLSTSYGDGTTHNLAPWAPVAGKPGVVVIRLTAS